MRTKTRYEYDAIVDRVIDGDTVVLDVDLGLHVWLRRQTVRLIAPDRPEVAINAPEVWTREGAAIRDIVRELLPSGTEVVVETHRDKTGKYGRWLADVYFDVIEDAEPLLGKGVCRLSRLVEDWKAAPDYLVTAERWADRRRASFRRWLEDGKGSQS